MGATEPTSAVFAVKYNRQLSVRSRYSNSAPWSPRLTLRLDQTPHELPSPWVSSWWLSLRSVHLGTIIAQGVRDSARSAAARNGDATKNSSGWYSSSSATRILFSYRILARPDCIFFACYVFGRCATAFGGFADRAQTVANRVGSIDSRRRRYRMDCYPIFLVAPPPIYEGSRLQWPRSARTGTVGYHRPRTDPRGEEGLLARQKHKQI